MRLMIPIIVVFGVVFVADIKTDRAQRDEMESLRQELTERKAQIETLNDQVDRLQALVKSVFGRVPEKTFSIPVTVTSYTARPQETNSEPWFTADMSLSRVGMLAVSRDLLNDIGLEYGEAVILEDFGVFKVHDTMNERYSRRVDILMANVESAKRFGKKEGVTLTWVR